MRQVSLNNFILIFYYTYKTEPCNALSFRTIYTSRFMFFVSQRKQKDVAKENEFYLQLLQQALPLEQQAMSMQQIQPQVQSQTQHVTASLEQHIKTQTQKLSPQYNPSPEKSRGSLYLLFNKYSRVCIHIFFFVYVCIFIARSSAL